VGKVQRRKTPVEADDRAVQALLEERYLSVRSQVPIIYLVVLVSLVGLQITTSGYFRLGVNLPTVVLTLAVVRLWMWRRSDSDVSHEEMQRNLRLTAVVTGILCLAVLFWCINLFTASPGENAYIFLFASLIALGAAHGLSSVPFTAMLPVLMLALPMAILAMTSKEGRSIGAATALTLVALLVLRQLRDHGRQFESLVRSRSAYLSEQEKAAHSHAEAARAAKTDFLTGLPNRRAFIEALQARLERPDPRCAVAILDLDHFKPVNDTLGHAAGDDLLRIIAERLRDSEQGRALVARLGGDEFAVILEHAHSADFVQRWATALIGKIAEPAILQDRPIRITASCGVMLFEEAQPRTVRSVLTSADIALYHAKEQPSPKVAIYNEEVDTPYVRRMEVERALRQASPSEISLLFNQSLSYEPVE
jgi:diguanylate cyclase (GGDEF)-like protein